MLDGMLHGNGEGNKGYGAKDKQEEVSLNS